MRKSEVISMGVNLVNLGHSITTIGELLVQNQQLSDEELLKVYNAYSFSFKKAIDSNHALMHDLLYRQSEDKLNEHR